MHTKQWHQHSVLSRYVTKWKSAHKFSRTLEMPREADTACLLGRTACWVHSAGVTFWCGLWVVCKFFFLTDSISWVFPEQGRLEKSTLSLWAMWRYVMKTKAVVVIEFCLTESKLAVGIKCAPRLSATRTATVHITNLLSQLSLGCPGGLGHVSLGGKIPRQSRRVTVGSALWRESQNPHVWLPVIVNSSPLLPYYYFKNEFWLNALQLKCDFWLKWFSWAPIHCLG